MKNPPAARPLIFRHGRGIAFAALYLANPVSAQEPEVTEGVPAISPTPVTPLQVEPGIIPFAPGTEPSINPLDGSPEGAQAPQPTGAAQIDEPLTPIDPSDPNQAALEELLAAEDQTQDEAEEEDEEEEDLWSQPNNFGAGLLQAPGTFGLSNGISGFDSGINSLPFSNMRNPVKSRGLMLSTYLTGTYDTNPFRSNAVPGGGQDEGDFITSLGGTIGYHTTESIWTYGVDYTGGYNLYANNPDLGGYNQSAQASLDYNGSSLEASLSAGIDYGSGANRLYASVVDEIRYNWGLGARYRISPKTSLTGSFSQSFTTLSGDDTSDTDSTDFKLAALWRYSQLTEFGPGVRYSMRSGADGNGRTSIGPTLNLNYQLSRKVSLAASVGTDFAEYDVGATPDPSRFTSLSLNYRASSLWSMNLSLVSDAQASFSTAGQFEQVTSLRFGYDRRIRRAIWNLGVSLESRSTEDLDPLAPTSTPDRNYVSFDTSIGMPVFTDSTEAVIFLRYDKQDGSPTDSWDALQIGLGLGHTF